MKTLHAITMKIMQVRVDNIILSGNVGPEESVLTHKHNEVEFAASDQYIQQNIPVPLQDTSPPLGGHA